VFLLVFSMGTAWLSSLTVLCYLCIGTCVFQGKLQYIHTTKTVSTEVKLEKNETSSVMKKL